VLKVKRVAKKATRVALRIVAKQEPSAAQQMLRPAKQTRGAAHLLQTPKKQIQRVSKPGQGARVRNYSRASSIHSASAGFRLPDRQPMQFLIERKPL
jgi:hypothetical protein